LKNVCVEADVKKLAKLRESDGEKTVKLEENFKKIQYILDGVVKDLATTKTENEKLKVEIKQVRYQSRHVPGAQALLPVQASDERAAMSHLGEMCWQIQAAMYKKILPQHFTPI
jgi:archaellum component FlaC